MARRLKPQKTKHLYHHTSGIRAILYLDRNSLDFFAEVQGEEVRHVTADGCERLFHKKCEELQTFTWKKIITGSTVPKFMPTAAEIKLVFGVHEVALGADGQWREREEFPRGSGEYRISNYHGPTSPEDVEERDRREGEFIIPWSQETEEALERLRQGIIEMKKKLYSLLTHKDVAVMLQSVVSKNLLKSGLTCGTCRFFPEDIEEDHPFWNGNQVDCPGKDEQPLEGEGAGYLSMYSEACSQWRARG